MTRTRKECDMKKWLSIVVLCAAASLAVAAPSAGQAANTGEVQNNTQAAELRQDMRKLWTDHVVWTRDYIIAAVADLPDAKSAETRLMKNQDDIGAAVAKYYGASAGSQLTTMLKQHIAIAGDLV